MLPRPSSTPSTELTPLPRGRKRRSRRPEGAAPATGGGAGATGPPRASASAAGGTRPPGPTAGDPPLSRTEARNAAVRAELVPLREGERPTAVTVGAIVALVLGLTTVVLYAAGTSLRGGGTPAVVQVVFQSGIMLVMAYGMWRARYWAVLGMEALLGLVIVVFSLSSMFAENLQALLVAAAIVLPAGALFWHLVKAMARIQMPRRP